jgi:hypothetical protein
LLGDWTQKVGSHNTAKCLLEGLKEFMWYLSICQHS